MPELPEVEVVRAGLAPAATGARVDRVDVLEPRSLRRHEGPSEDFISRLTGAVLQQPRRRGKFIWIPIAGEGTALVVHLGMSGQVLLRARDAPLDRLTRIVLDITHPTEGPLRIDFVDQRIFGSMAIDDLVPDDAGDDIPTQVAHIARDPMDPHFDDKRFLTALAKKATTIKRALLDQTLVSGIGNIYADEALWAARVHYDQPTRTLSSARAVTLLAEVRLVLGKALAEGGTSFDYQYVNVNGNSGYFSQSLNAYGQTGLPCPRCGRPIVRENFMNRGSHFCAHCQRIRLWRGVSAREAVLRRVLDAVAGDDMTGAIDVADDAFRRDGDGWHRALGAFAAFLATDYARAASLADEALEMAGDDSELRQLARAARGLAAAGATVDGPDHLAEARTELDGEPASGSLASIFTTYLLAEASLACARLDLAAEFVALAPQALFDHPYATVMTIMRVRLLVFRGRISEASELLATIPPAGAGMLQLLVAATETLVRGNAAERAEVRALADRLEATQPAPADYLTAGCYLLAAFGLVAVGDVSRSARLALLAGGDVTLGRLTTVDRGLAFELLVAAAAIEGDLDAADAWCERAQPLLDDPISNSTVQRLMSRVALLHGDAAAAVDWADRAVASARAQGRFVEAAEGEIVAARARIASSQSGDASARLEALVEGADETGHLAARRAASRELRAAGRRLRPAPGSDWAGLSERERDIALMVAEGLGNREIAVELHLSEHTVRAHVSRVLAAFGAASRFVVAARVAELFPDPRPAAAPALTPRQHAVAERIARGAGNAEIGSELGLSVKTVEKHVGEIFRRWEVGTRVGVARRYAGTQALMRIDTRTPGSSTPSRAT